MDLGFRWEPGTIDPGTIGPGTIDMASSKKRRAFDALAASAARQVELRELEIQLRQARRPDYQAIGLLDGHIVVGRQLRGVQACSPSLYLAASALVDSHTVLRHLGRGGIVFATLDGMDTASVLTLMRALDHISNARYENVTITDTTQRGR